ncbi:acyl transferase/acyl hydrolase/lysophospholipase [Ilyonectria sp. MPI-CAGE-AT-0026]|nr:acyl transferase/acyl hydrolase/lysophospholipase [Ilyonectria sp. MPI-CAGE-AT-0026]
MPGTEPSKRLRLLSLDGGGVRGLSSLQIIKQLMETIDPDNPPKPCEVFDMIGGTSTGGLVAIMLGRLRMDVDECIDAYTDLSDKIFRKQKHRISLNGTIQGRFDSEELERAIKEVIQEQGFDVNELLKDDANARCKVFVCAVRKEITQPVHFRSYRYPRGGGTLFADTRIWEACRATSAATSFFDPITIGKHKNEFVDGALGNNNPVRSVFTEAATFWDVEGRLPDHLDCLVSVGTGMPSTRPVGDRFWEIAKTLVKIATESESTATRFAEENSLLEDNDRYYRFNVMQGLQGVELENAAAKPTIVAATEAYLEGRQVFKRMKACGEKLDARRSAFSQETQTFQPSSRTDGMSNRPSLPAPGASSVPWQREVCQFDRVE